MDCRRHRTRKKEYAKSLRSEKAELQRSLEKVCSLLQHNSPVARLPSTGFSTRANERGDVLTRSQIKAETQHLLAENESIKAALSSRGIDATKEVSIPSSLTQASREGRLNSVVVQDGEPRAAPEEEYSQGSSIGEVADPRVDECRTLLLKDIETYRLVTYVPLLTSFVEY